MAEAGHFQSNLCSLLATIPSGQTTSNELDLCGAHLVGLQLPASMTGSSVTFLVATSSGGTFQPMIDGVGNTVLKISGVNKLLALDPAFFLGCHYLKIVSSSTEAADRQIELILRPIA